MKNDLIVNWNDAVGKNDIVWHLGDFSFLNSVETEKILAQLKGQKHLIMGNHDRRRSMKWWRGAGFDTAINVPVIMEDGYILSHEPFDVDDTHFFNIHGHLHSESHVLETEADGRYFNVSVDVTNFAPVKFDYIKERLGK